MRTVMLLTLLLAGLATASLYLGTESKTLAAAVPATMADLAVRNADIAFFARRVERDPHSAVDRAQLAGLYLQRSRETGDPEDYRRAEDAARASLALRSVRNGRAQLILASSLLSQHRFREAYESAQSLLGYDPTVVAYRALIAEIELELGEYDLAARSFASLVSYSEQLAVAPRLARWYEITGQPGKARVLLESALQSATQRGDLPREQIAWFHLRVGDFWLRNGDLDRAEEVLLAGLATEPGDFRLLSALTRLEFMRRHWQRAIDYGTAIGESADMTTLTIIGDAYHALGDNANAETHYAAVESSNTQRPEPYARQWTQFRLDHNRYLPETLAILEQEIVGRKDVLGYDQLAWAYHLTGNNGAASQAIREALRMGTRDATLFFHAGVIAQRSGDESAAAHYLREALSINRYFHPFYADQAREILAGLGAGAESSAASNLTKLRPVL